MRGFAPYVETTCQRCGGHAHADRDMTGAFVVVAGTKDPIWRHSGSLNASSCGQRAVPKKADDDKVRKMIGG